MEVVLRYENYMFKSLTVVDFTMLHVVTHRLSFSSRVLLLVINLRLKRRLERSFLMVKQLPFHFAPQQIQE